MVLLWQVLRDRVCMRSPTYGYLIRKVLVSEHSILMPFFILIILLCCIGGLLFLGIVFWFLFVFGVVAGQVFLWSGRLE